MTEIFFLEYPPCSTCQKARRWLEANQVEFTARHIVKDRPSADELRRWHKLSGLPLKKFFNTSGLVYKSLNLKKRLPNMSETEQYEILASDGMLVKRPLLITTKGVIPGFNPDAWSKLLGLA